MTARRNVLTMLGGATLLAACPGLAACREPATRTAAAPPVVPDLLVADTDAGLVTLRGGQVTGHGAALAAPDARRVYATTPLDGGATALSTVEVRTGRELARARLAGRWVARAVSPRGDLVVLSPPPATGSGRTRSAIMIASQDGARHTLDLAGNIEPDAMTYDGTGLFVLDWLPATAPDRYRVRLVDFATGTPRPLLTRAKVPVPSGAEEEMRGDGRQAVSHPNGRVLYTLYTHQGDHQHTRDILAARPSGVHAFVHVLHLEERWAYCLDLPDPFGHGPAAGHALALSADGRRLMVADVTSGRLAVADTEALAISTVVRLAPGAGPAGMATIADRCFLAAGASIHVVDLTAGTVTATWSAGGEVRGLTASPDGTRLYAGHPDGIAWLDLGTGRRAGSVRVPGWRPRPPPPPP
ncbi:hypothetical protein WEI85_40760 [Actinomycetes bacterium KLBMP 9797]